MRIPFTDREIRLMATPSGDLMDVQGGSSGSDGESHYRGIWDSGSEINPIFRGRNRWLLYNEMRNDPMVKAILWLYKLPIRSAVWDVRAAGDGKDPIDRAVGEAIKWQFGLGVEEGKLSQTHDEWLTQRLLCLNWGASFEEILWADDLDWWRDPTAGDELRPMRPIARLALRRPSTVSKIEWDEKTGRVKTLEQDLPNTKPIPGNKLAHYAIEREGDSDWMGESLLRAMYGSWKVKKSLFISGAIAWDRWASGIPEVRYPQGGGAGKKERAERIGENLRVHERAYVAFEGQEQDGWGLKIHTANVQDPGSFLKFCNEEMAASAVTMFSRLGTTETGSRAVGDTLAGPYYLAVQAVAKQIASQSTRHVVRRFVDVNFGEEVETPQLVPRKIASRSVESVVNVLSLLAGTGFNVIAKEILDDVLEMLDLDALPDDFPLQREGADAFPGATRRNGGGSPEQRRTAGRSAATVRAALAGGGIPGALG